MFLFPDDMEVFRGSRFIEVCKNLLVILYKNRTDKWISNSFFFNTISGILFLNSKISAKLLFPSMGLVSESSTDQFIINRGTFHLRDFVL